MWQFFENYMLSFKVTSVALLAFTSLPPTSPVTDNTRDSYLTAFVSLRPLPPIDISSSAKGFPYPSFISFPNLPSRLSQCPYLFPVLFHFKICCHPATPRWMLSSATSCSHLLMCFKRSRQITHSPWTRLICSSSSNGWLNYRYPRHAK